MRVSKQSLSSDLKQSVKTRISNRVYSEFPCKRCGSKTYIGNVRKEKIVTHAGISVIEHSEIICTNKVCQSAFVKNRMEDAERYQEIKLAKEKKAQEALENIQRNRKKRAT
jgi:hypothetical protein